MGKSTKISTRRRILSPSLNPQPVQPAEDPRSRRRIRDRMMTSDAGMTPMASNVIGMPGSMNGASEVVVNGASLL